MAVAEELLKGRRYNICKGKYKGYTVIHRWLSRGPRTYTGCFKAVIQLEKYPDGSNVSWPTSRDRELSLNVIGDIIPIPAKIAVNHALDRWCYVQQLREDTARANARLAFLRAARAARA